MLLHAEEEHVEACIDGVRYDVLLICLLGVDVSHHVDEIPPGMTHVLFLKDGKAMTRGTITECFTAENLSECFSMSLHLQQRDNGRYSAWAQ